MVHSEPDHDIWLRFISGDPEAFSGLYDQYAGVLYAFGMRYSTDRDLVKDCIHDLFIDLHAYRKNLAQDVNVKFYLLKSFRRKLHAAHRKSSLLSFDRWNSDDNMAIHAFDFGIEQEMITDEKEREVLQHLAAEINLLPDRQREILYLRFHQDLDYEEIAAIMQISVPTCRTFIYRALKQLRGKLEFGAILLILCW
ncbi:DNA-directed RNA polymerase sigma-70 factor [Dyadobacter beijingensis]|uniref:DNA-directed RNA polymerase sigma-70 factor n=1 Tax=Dyadobacter beijingensis TaxID=365489 RepID=A0ABQ2I6T6_9BACT|nr:sigma-70 family RNA polymerase sigma factor [Dyadobacter beijingensis]GGN01216.1 DNA-directed RNA polymerase sigma-70 factor [Dyadobacter beijingensis]